MERQRNETTSQARRNVFSEDVKKSLRLLSEERLSPREVKTCVFVIFLPEIRAKKWGGWPDSNRRPSGPQPDALTNWATATKNLLRKSYAYYYFTIFEKVCGKILFFYWANYNSKSFKSLSLSCKETFGPLIGPIIKSAPKFLKISHCFLEETPLKIIFTFSCLAV